MAALSASLRCSSGSGGSSRRPRVSNAPASTAIFSLEGEWLLLSLPWSTVGFSMIGFVGVCSTFSEGSERVDSNKRYEEEQEEEDDESDQGFVILRSRDPSSAVSLWTMPSCSEDPIYSILIFTSDLHLPLSTSPTCRVLIGFPLQHSPLTPGLD